MNKRLDYRLNFHNASLELFHFAKEARLNPTEAEASLWGLLKGKSTSDLAAKDICVLRFDNQESLKIKIKMGIEMNI